MALRKKGKHWYGDSQEDIQGELLRYSRLNGYGVEHWGDAVCECNSRTFGLFVDEEQGVAVRSCARCGEEYAMGDSEEFLEEAELEECECACGEGQFEVTVGVALYPESEDVKWLYLGCRCVGCGLVGCYGDWKNEFGNYREFLKLV